MICQNCGGEVRSGSKFCPICGSEIVQMGAFADRTDSGKKSAGRSGNPGENLSDKLKSVGENIKTVGENITETVAQTVSSAKKSIPAVTIARPKSTTSRLGSADRSVVADRTVRTARTANSMEKERKSGRFPIALIIVPVAVIVLGIVLVIAISRSGNESSEPTTVNDLINGTGLAKCKYEGCEETQIFKEGYCQEHYYLEKGSNIVGDVLNGEMTCQYAGCDSSETYQNGYCKKHYLMLQAESTVNDVLSGEKSCKYPGCDSTDIYDDGYCKDHYFLNAGSNAVSEIMDGIFGDRDGN